MAKRYRVLGKPSGAPLAVLQDRAVGDEFDADLDRDEERALVDAGALEVVKQSVKTDEKPSRESR